MRVWLITIGEPLPIDAGSPRLLRAGLLAQALGARGHQVVWWSSAFDHVRKTFRTAGEATYDLGPGLRLELLNGGGYRRNVSLARVRDHRRLARRFDARAPSEPRPDVIMVSLPSLELAVSAVRYGGAHAVPVVVDIRDLWPDVMVDLLPTVLRPIGRVATASMRRDVRIACAGATTITGNSRMFVHWGLRHAGRPGTPLDREFPHGYPDPRHDPALLAAARESLARRGVDLSPDRATATFVGTIGRQFDLQPLLDAARMLRADDRFQFVIAGDGERCEHYRAAARSLPNVVLPGWLSAPEIAALLRSTMAGVLPYENREHWTQSTPNKFAEYLSAGVPVLLSLDHGEMLDTARIWGCGSTYAHSADRLAAALGGMVDHPTHTEEMRRAARRAFDQQFRADVVYGALCDYLEALPHAR